MTTAVSPTRLTRRVASCNCTALRQAGRHLTRFYDAALAASGLRVTQYAILAVLRIRGPLGMSEVAEWLVMDRATIGHNLRPLQREGLVDIRITRHDRRAREVALTKLGREREASARRAWQRAQDHFEREFGSDHAAEMRRQMQAVIQIPLPIPG